MHYRKNGIQCYSEEEEEKRLFWNKYREPSINEYTHKHNCTRNAGGILQLKHQSGGGLTDQILVLAIDSKTAVTRSIIRSRRHFYSSIYYNNTRLNE